MIGTLYKHRRIIKSLGLRKVHHVREVKDCPEIRGQIKKVEYLVSIVD
jgi:large subunit ribosomal protein L30